MLLKINKDVLVNGLQKVEKAVGKSQVPVLQGIFFEATANALTFIGANDEQVISVDITVDENISVEQPGKIVFGKGILDVIKRLRSDVVTIKTDDTNLQYHIEAGLSKFNFSGYDAEEYPKFTEPSNEPILEFAYEELKENVDKLAFAASTEDSRAILQGIHIASTGEDGNQLKFVSTNSHMLSQKVVNKQSKDEISIVPKAKSLVEALRVYNSNDTIKVFANATHIIFKSDEVTVRSRLLDGNYPQTDRLVMTQFKAIIELDKNEFISALEQVQIVGQSTSGSMPNAATVSLSGINLKIENNLTEFGTAEVEIPLVELQKNTEDVDIKFAFNVKYMISLVKATDGNIKIGFIDSMKPISILGSESNGEYKLILPIRTR